MKNSNSLTLKIEDLISWSDNPRDITPENLERLRKQVRQLGQYKPLLVTKAGEQYVVLGGNMRLKVYQELGYKEVWCSLVDAPDDQTKTEYALSDNDAAGHLLPSSLAGLLGKVPNIDLKIEDFYEFLYQSFLSMFTYSKAGAAFYVCHADSERVNFTKAYQDAGGYLSSVIIWVKNNSTFGRSDYSWRHEPIIYGWNSKGSHQWYGDHQQDTIWNIDRPAKSEEHPTMKPIELITRAIKNSSKMGDIILDLFGGSGSTLVAAQSTGRVCYMMELDPKYCDVIRKRYANMVDPEGDWQKLTPSINHVTKDDNQ